MRRRLNARRLGEGGTTRWCAPLIYSFSFPLISWSCLVVLHSVRWGQLTCSLSAGATRRAAPRRAPRGVSDPLVPVWRGARRCRRSACLSLCPCVCLSARPAGVAVLVAPAPPRRPAVLSCGCRSLCLSGPSRGAQGHTQRTDRRRCVVVKASSRVEGASKTVRRARLPGRIASPPPPPSSLHTTHQDKNRRVSGAYEDGRGEDNNTTQFAVAFPPFSSSPPPLPLQLRSPAFSS